MISIITSTRADWGLLLPLARELRRRGIELDIIASNMHIDRRLGFTADEIKESGFEVSALLRSESGAINVTAASVLGLGQVFDVTHPEAVIILGDRSEMLGAATAAVIKGVPIIHIAGGTVSEGAIDDSIRHAITKLSTLHLVETIECRRRVVQMGEDPSTVITCGALGVYNALNQQLLSKEQLEEWLGKELPEKFLVGTLHAATREKISPEEQMATFLKACEMAMEQHPGLGYILTYPNNDVDPQPLIDQLNEFADRFPDKVILRPSLGMVRYLSAVSLSKGVIGNSSSGVVEVASLGVPTLDIGIRQKGRQAAESVLHCDCDLFSILLGIDHILSDEMQEKGRLGVNPYEQKDTPQKMADAIENFKFFPYPSKKFYDYSGSKEDSSAE